MSEPSDLQAAVKAIVDANRYMTLATAAEDGTPWASPVWYASADYREFFWVSSPEARHSRNLSVRPELAIVIFDSGQAPGSAGAVYVSATAAQVPEPDLDRGLAVYSRVSQAQSLRAWNRSDVSPPAKHRLYRATAVEHFVLSSTDDRLPVDLG
jgi:nitroimidazol reductase NimA-like FMN-containing flavoprotein (pyridoxamine 5'-phosphate oxidase superfamily)